MIWSIASLLITVTLIVGWICRADIRNRVYEATERGIRIATFNPKASIITETRTLLATDRFEAWTHCPSCGEFDCHAMREPLPWNREDWLAWNSGRTAWIERNTWTQTITSWGGHTSKVIDSAPEYPIAEPVNETQFATVRICKCGKEWGQK